MELNKYDITAIVLAGGQSSRMGFNKATADIDGASMLLRMIEKVKQITSSVVISVGDTVYQNIHLPQIPDQLPQCGPLGGIYSVLKDSNTSLNLVVSCDMPLVSVQLLKHIVACAKENEALITVPVDENNQIQMMCAVYRKAALPYVKQQLDAQNYKMKGLLDLVSAEYLCINKAHPLYNEYAFMNINRQNTLAEARQLWNSQKK